jgi:hypothetical protein
MSVRLHSSFDKNLVVDSLGSCRHLLQLFERQLVAEKITLKNIVKE